MSWRHILLAVFLTALWGTNFIAIKLGGEAAPPMFLVMWRYILTAFPLVFFLRRPPVSWPVLITYGLMMGAIQFSLLFMAVRMGMPAGLAALLMQTQVMFTMGLAVIFLQERPGRAQIAGACISFLGLGVIGVERMGEGSTFIPFAMCLTGAFFWAASNILNSRVGKVDPLAFVAWTALSPIPALFLLSLVVEGPQAMLGAMTQPSGVAIASLVYMVIGSTLIGNSAWSYLLTLYPASVVAPFSLLVPVFGMASGLLALGERYTWQEAAGGALVAIGLAFGVLAPRLRQRLRKG